MKLNPSLIKVRDQSKLHRYVLDFSNKSIVRKLVEHIEVSRMYEMHCDVAQLIVVLQDT